MLGFCSGARARSAFLLKVTFFANRHAGQQIFATFVLSGGIKNAPKNGSAERLSPDADRNERTHERTHGR